MGTPYAGAGEAAWREAGRAHQREQHAGERPPAGKSSCDVCGAEVTSANLGKHAARHDSRGWPSCRFGCGHTASQPDTVLTHEKGCLRNPEARPSLATVTCSLAGCGEEVDVSPGNSRAKALAHHMSSAHGIGSFWPCPCHGQPLGAPGAAAGAPQTAAAAAALVCAFEPASQKSNVKKHLLLRHGKSEREARTLLDATKPIVRRGFAVLAPQGGLLAQAQAQAQAQAHAHAQAQASAMAMALTADAQSAAFMNDAAQLPLQGQPPRSPPAQLLQAPKQQQQQPQLLQEQERQPEAGLAEVATAF